MSDGKPGSEQNSSDASNGDELSSDELKQRLTQLMQQWAMKQAEAHRQQAEANRLGKLCEEFMGKIEIKPKGEEDAEA